jgi:hypothetical protein
MLHLPLQAAVECRAIEPKETTVTDERQLEPCHLVVQRVPRHAEVLRGGVHVEPARRDDRTLSRGGLALLRCEINGRNDVS